MSYKYKENPSTKNCWELCTSCFRCQNKGLHDKCKSCSGRHDPEVKKDPYHSRDACRCREGILCYRLQNGRFIQRKFESNPFKGQVMTDTESQDEREWSQYVNEMRERYDNEKWDGVLFDDGTSTYDWTKNSRWI